LKIANDPVIFFLISFIVCFTFLFSIVYGFSPKLKTEFLSKEIQNYIYYGPINDSNKTLNYLQQSSDLDRVYVTSNGTHLEIKFLFNEFLNKLKNALLNSSTVPHNLFINIFIDSDDDETIGFLGYNYRYLLTHDNPKFYDNNLNSTKTNFSQNFTQNRSNNNDILEDEELEEIITRTINSKDLIEKLDWSIRGYELLDYDFQPLFFSSNLTKQYLSIIPDGFRLTLDLEQIGYPINYAVLVEVGRKSENYKFSHVFGKIHVPRPDLILNDRSININNGKNSVVLEFNNTGLYNLNVKAELSNNDLSNDNGDLSMNFSQGNQFNLLNGKGVLPMDIIANSNYNQKNLVVPLNLSYSVIGENDFIKSDLNNSLTNENIYNKILYLNLNLVNERNRLIDFAEIPSQYIAVFLGAVFSFFVPTIARSTKEYFQKRTANKLLKNILKEQNSDNPDISIKNIMNILRSLKQEFIKGKITKDQYEILKENISDVLKNLTSKKNDNTTTDKK
jgi:histone H3/H4